MQDIVFLIKEVFFLIVEGSPLLEFHMKNDDRTSTCHANYTILTYILIVPINSTPLTPFLCTFFHSLPLHFHSGKKMASSSLLLFVCLAVLHELTNSSLLISSSSEREALVRTGCWRNAAPLNITSPHHYNWTGIVCSESGRLFL